MVALLMLNRGKGDLRRCNERCYEAEKPRRKCCCGGRNHGVGLKQAVKNTQELLDEHWCKDPQGRKNGLGPVVDGAQLYFF